VKHIGWSEGLGWWRGAEWGFRYAELVSGGSLVRALGPDVRVTAPPPPPRDKKLTCGEE